MSHQAVEWALHRAPMLLTDKGKPDTTARFVLVELADHAHEDGTNSFPSALHIRWATGLDVRTIERAITRLEKGKLLVRDGMTRAGAVRWTLNMTLERPESDWAELDAARAIERKAGAARVRKHRMKPVDNTSVTHSTSVTDVVVTDAECVTTADVTDSASDVTDSASDVTDSASDVTDAAPPEPSVTTRNLHTPGTSTGGTLPPDPLRPEVPPSSDLRNDHVLSLLVGGPEQDHLVGDHQYARAREEDHRPECDCGVLLDPDGTCFICSPRVRGGRRGW